MNIPKDFIDNAQIELNKKKEKMLRTIESLKSQDPFSDTDRLIDNAASDTEAKEESGHDRIEAIEKELESNIKDINQALEKIKNGSYGKCHTCGKNIDLDRLTIKPTALRCMNCKSLREKSI